MSKLAERLREIRKERKISVSKASEIFGLSYATWNTWENEKSRPNVDLLLKISSEFNVCSSWLLGETEYRTIEEIRASGNATANGAGAVAAIGQGNTISTPAIVDTGGYKERIKFLEARLEAAEREKNALLQMLASITGK